GAGTSTSGFGVDHLPSTTLFSTFSGDLFFDPVSDPIVDEGQDITLIMNVYGGVPPYTYSITHPLFINENNLLTWQTNFTDAETYGSGLATITVEDSYHFKTMQNITLTVNNAANTECSAGIRNSCTVSSSLTLPANQIYNLRDGIRVTGDALTLNCQGSTFDGSGFIYLNDGIVMDGVSGVTLQNCNVRNYDEGIKLISSSNNNLSLFRASTTRIGISLQSSHANQILGSTINSTLQHGIYLFQSNNNAFNGGTVMTVLSQNSGIRAESSLGTTIKNMVISNIPNENAVRFISSSQSLIEGNTLELSSNGLRFDSSSQSIVRGNNFRNNSARGILINSGANNNQIYNNNFINNPNHAQDFGSFNVWSFSNEGNYWSDYYTPAQGCVDANFNGFCDGPKTFPNNQDPFPFTNINGWNNMWPIITSTPVTTAFNNTLYIYDVEAVDPDNDPLTFKLQGPRGMRINTTSGLITWMARKPRNVNSTLVPVTVRVSDSHNGMSSQSWQILVTST
ncbi:MAG: right-handed parallel beta-helix repeat-containing protein, partial [Nanoarchaeota archaeon]